ncbi:MAG TPA: alkaline phosphatase, partial [Candidatus Deferrimicrobium sp.]|nr:alkaline phosphatase [Candidatus Deferrimicrobium sp.]
PSVFDLTQAAIRLLHGPRGFFAFIESENIDRASHANDIASVIHDYREFDRAVGVAYEFYRKYSRETLIIVASDHESGGLGMTLALKDLSSTKGNNQVAGCLHDFNKIRGIKISLQSAAKLLGPNPSSEAVDKLMTEHFPGFVLAPEFREKIVNNQSMSRTIFAEPVANALGMMVANNTQIYWQNTAHSNHPVLVAALGVGAERFKGYYDNADFGQKLKALMEGKKQQ